MKRLRQEDGMAVVVALAALTLLGLLAAVVVTSSVSLSNSSERDRASKRALAAAEAGLAQATFRINRLAPANGLCVTTLVVTPLTNGLCPTVTETVADGATFTYRVSPILNLTDRCAGLPVQTTSGGRVTIVQRCITSTGTVEGHDRRVQARVAAFQGSPVFPLNGIIGLDSVTVKNNAFVDGWLGSNGLISMKNNNGVTGGVNLGPSAPDPNYGGSTISTITRRTPTEGGWVLAPVDIGDSATANENVRISNGLTNPKGLPYDSSNGTSYNAATRFLSLGNNSSVTLGGGTYNFCSVSMGNNSSILIAPRAADQAQAIRIFIDSPYRQGSGCPLGTGNLTMGQGASFGSPPGGDPRNLQVYVYGWSPSENPVPSEIDFNNNGWVGSFYAPQSAVVFKNDAVIRGGLAARSVEFKNNMTFGWAASVGDIRARTLTLFYRTAWRECTPTPTAADPNSGC
jgi:Tfp pilus assembly protein PilX